MIFNFYKKIAETFRHLKLLLIFANCPNWTNCHTSATSNANIFVNFGFVAIKRNCSNWARTNTSSTTNTSIFINFHFCFPPTNLYEYISINNFFYQTISLPKAKKPLFKHNSYLKITLLLFFLLFEIEIRKPRLIDPYT